jgi:hypothetical protein
MSTTHFSTFAFADALDAAKVDAQKRQALIIERAEALGGHPFQVPADWNARACYWPEELYARYHERAEAEGWEPLPGYYPPRPCDPNRENGWT